MSVLSNNILYCVNCCSILLIICFKVHFMDRTKDLLLVKRNLLLSVRGKWKSSIHGPKSGLSTFPNVSETGPST